MPRFQTFHANMHAETTPTILHWIVASLLEVSMPTDWFAVCRPRRKSLQFLRHLRCRLGRTWSLSLWWGTIRPTIAFPFVLFRWGHCTLRLWEGNQVHIDTRIMHQPLECLVQRGSWPDNAFSESECSAAKSENISRSAFKICVVLTGEKLAGESVTKTVINLSSHC